MTGTDTIIEVAEIDCRLEPYRWSFEREAAAEIEAHWIDRRRDRPSLFDGQVLLMRDVRVASDRLRCSCFTTRFRSFLAWRDFGFPGRGVVNCFGMSALQANDGTFLLGEMSERTAGAGRLYFPAGTPEPSDVRHDGRVDLEGNVRRELQEETGLAADDVSFARGWVVVADGPYLACIKSVKSQASPATLQDRLQTFNAAQSDPELARFIGVKSPADYDESRMPQFMLRYLNWALKDVAQAR